MSASDRPARRVSARSTGQRSAANQPGTNSISNGEASPPPAEDRTPSVSLATDLLAVMGRDGHLKRLGPTFLQAVGYTEAELLDRPFISYIHPTDRAATRAALEKFAQGEPTLGLKHRFRCRDGSYRRLAWTAMPTPEGCLYGVADDTHVERRQPEQQRARLLARQLAAALAQNEGLLASVCHDVQQPLTVIRAQTQLVQRQLARGETLPPGQLETCLAYILAATNRVRGMVQDLLDASVQQSGHAPVLLLVRTDLVALARQAVGEYELVSDRHKFLFKTDVPRLEATVDEARVQRVVANLLTNAIKYSPKGGVVRVTVTTVNGPDGQSALLLVGDEGVGIPRNDLPHIFDRFRRGANAVGRFAGTGLGLASARELVQLHGGSISVQSEEDKGSTFVVCLPLTPPADAGASGD